jgi:preprotein translocase subunit SecY
MNIVEVIPLLIIFPTIFFIVKAALNYSTRKQLIQKGLVNEDIKHLFYANGNSIERYLPSSLKWGLVLVFSGLALVVIKLLPYYIEGEVIFGVMLIAAGAGLLIYYTIANKKAKEAKKERQMQQN